MLRLLDVTLFSISAILVVDQLTATASIGVSSIGWWAIAIVFFFVPSALVIAELSTTYPEQGGIYAWVLRAFGRKMAARTTYWYWVNVGMWMPSVYLLFTGVMVALFWSSASVFEQSLVAIALVWVTVLVCALTLDVSAKVTGASAALKAIIILALVIGSVVFAIRHGAANSFSGGNMLPHFGIAKTFLPVLVYQLLGFELVSSMSGEMKDPERNMPRAILISGFVVAALYVAGTVGMLLAMPVAQIGLTEGLVETFKVIFGNLSGFVWLLSLGVMATYFGNMVTWALGANKAAAEAAAAGELPAILGRENRRGSPVWALVLTGLIATVVLLVTGIFITSQDNLYFAIFAASSAIFLLPYLWMFPAVIRLRQIDPARRRPFRVPLGVPGLWLCTALTTAGSLATLILFLWTPGEPIDWSYTGP
ncbi:MAG TPA: APC family permease, partial [Burkholderiales bacterium]|nr:APC family permease [Burkholderiales bacterium]